MRETAGVGSDHKLSSLITCYHNRLQYRLQSPLSSHTRFLTEIYRKHQKRDERLLLPFAESMSRLVQQGKTSRHTVGFQNVSIGGHVRQPENKVPAVDRPLCVPLLWFGRKIEDESTAEKEPMISSREEAERLAKRVGETGSEMETHPSDKYLLLMKRQAPPCDSGVSGNDMLVPGSTSEFHPRLQLLMQNFALLRQKLSLGTKKS